MKKKCKKKIMCYNDNIYMPKKAQKTTIESYYCFIDNEKTEKNQHKKQNLFTSDGNLYIEPGKFLSATIFTDNNDTRNTIPYVGNTQKKDSYNYREEDNPVIGFVINENDIEPIGMYLSDANSYVSDIICNISYIDSIDIIYEDSNFNKKETFKNIKMEDFLQKNKINLYEKQDLLKVCDILISKEKEKQDIIKELIKNINKLDDNQITKSIYEDLLNNTEDENINNHFKQELDSINSAKIYEILHEKYKYHKCFFSFNYSHWIDRGQATKYFINNHFSLKEITNIYNKHIKEALSNIKKEQKKDKGIFEFALNGFKRNISKIQLNEKGEVKYILYNELLLKPKQKNNIIKVKTLKLSLFNNTNKINEYDSRLNCDNNGYHVITPQMALQTIYVNRKKIIEWQKQKNLKTIPIVEEDGKTKEIDIDKLEQYLKDKAQQYNITLLETKQEMIQELNKYCKQYHIEKQKTKIKCNIQQIINKYIEGVEEVMKYLKEKPDEIDKNKENIKELQQKLKQAKYKQQQKYESYKQECEKQGILNDCQEDLESLSQTISKLGSLYNAWDYETLKKNTQVINDVQTASSDKIENEALISSDKVEININFRKGAPKTLSNSKEDFVFYNDAIYCRYKGIQSCNFREFIKIPTTKDQNNYYTANLNEAVVVDKNLTFKRKYKGKKKYKVFKGFGKKIDIDLKKILNKRIELSNTTNLSKNKKSLNQ